MSKVNWKDFDVEKVTYKDPEKKPVPGQSSEYSFMNIGYNYGTTENPRTGRLFIEFPKCKANVGIERKVEKDKEGRPKPGGRIQYSIRSEFCDPVEAEELYEKLTVFEKRTAKAMFEKASHPNMLHVKYEPEDDDETNIKMIWRDLSKFMYIPKDAKKRRVPGSVPSMYLKLDDGGYDLKYKSRFYMVVGKDPITKRVKKEPIEWEKLTEMCVYYTPITNFYRVFSGQMNRSIQHKMISATVDDLKEPEKPELQEELINQYAEDEDYIKRMKEGLKLAEERMKARHSPLTDVLSTGRSPEIDPRSATEIVAAVTKKPSANDESISSNVPPPDVKTPEPEVTSSFDDFISGNQETKKATVTDLSDIPSIP
jgi:hypothetical protein